MDLNTYVQAFRVWILVTIVTCNIKGQILSQNEEAAFSNDKPNESSEHIEADPVYTQPTKESDDIQATELADHTNEHRRKLIHNQKSKPKPIQSLNDDHKEYPFRTSEVPDGQTQQNTPSVGRARGYYGFPTGKHRSKKRYVDFRPLSGKTHHDLQLRDNLSFGSITNDGISYLPLDEHNYKLPKLLQSTGKDQHTTNGIYIPSGKHRPKTEIIQSAGKHRNEQSPKLIHPADKFGYPKLIHPIKKGMHPKPKVPNFPVISNHIYVYGGGVTYLMNKGKLKGFYKPATGGVESGGQGSGDDAGQFLTTGEPYDMQSEDEAGTTSKVSTRCSTAEPLPKLDPSYVPNETLEKFVNEIGDDQELYMQKNSNYIPPDRGSTPRHYIDDA